MVSHSMWPETGFFHHVVLPDSCTVECVSVVHRSYGQMTFHHWVSLAIMDAYLTSKCLEPIFSIPLGM